MSSATSLLRIPVRSRNLFNKTNMNWTRGCFLLKDGTYGYVNNNICWGTTDYIPVEGDCFTLSGTAAVYASICAYDENYQLICGVEYRNWVNEQMTGPVTIRGEGIKYIRFSHWNIYDDSMNGVQLEAGDTATPYQKYGIFLRPLSAYAAVENEIIPLTVYWIV